MPIDQETTRLLTQILKRFQGGCEEIAALLLPNAAAAPAVDVDRQIEILQKNYTEISNYDRHYSSTRSALTALLVTVGLVLATEPLKSMWTRATSCVGNFWDGIIDVLYHFPVSLLLFLLTIPVNLHFRRLTLSCSLLERAIEREIAIKAALPITGDMALPRELSSFIPPIGYYFRYDLGRMNRSIDRLPRLDEMTLLLIFVILEFSIILLYWEISKCSYWRPYLYGIFVAPLVVVFLLRCWRRNRPR